MTAIGFAGLGNMGVPMARNLQLFMKHQGLQSEAATVHVYNRTKSKADPLTTPEVGCKFIETPRELGRLCNTIFVMLLDDDATTSVVQELLQDAPNNKGKLIVCHSTLYPDTATKLDSLATSFGASYLACPVFGRPDAAAAKKLIMCTSGSATAKAEARSFLEAMGTIMDIGEQPAQANTLKLTGNFMIAGMIELLAEGMTLAEKNGVAREVFVDFVNRFFPAPALQGYCQRIAEDNFVAGATVSGVGVKDVSYVRRLGASSNTPVPVADVTFNSLLSARADGRGEQDWAALATAVRRAAGLPPTRPTQDKN